MTTHSNNNMRFEMKTKKKRNEYHTRHNRFYRFKTFHIKANERYGNGWAFVQQTIWKHDNNNTIITRQNNRFHFSRAQIPNEFILIWFFFLWWGQSNAKKKYFLLRTWMFSTKTIERMEYRKWNGMTECTHWTHYLTDMKRQHKGIWF